MTCCTGLDFHTHDSLSGDWSIRDIHASGQCKSLSCLSTWPWRCYPYNWYADSDCRIFNFRLFDLYEDALSQVAFAYHFQGEHLRRYLGQNFLQNFQVSFCSRFHFLDAFQTDNYLTYFSIKSKPINNLWPNLNKKNPTFFFLNFHYFIYEMASFFPQHIISIRDLSIEYVIHLLQASEHMKKVVENSGGDESLKNKVYNEWTKKKYYSLLIWILFVFDCIHIGLGFGILWAINKNFLFLPSGNVTTWRISHLHQWKSLKCEKGRVIRGYN